jgi:hypothetical protein
MGTQPADLAHPSRTPADLIDLNRYPILDLGSAAARELTRDCREQLDRTGACELPEFLTAHAVELLAREGDSFSGHAFHSVATGTPYLEVPEPSLPADHQRRIVDQTYVGVIAYDQFPPESLLRRLFDWDPLMEFIAAALNKDRLYRYADPMGALNLAVMGDGDRLHWHYDQTDFVTSIALRAAEQGGDFEYVPLIRSADEENYPVVQRLLLGGSDGVVRVPMNPGTMLLFEGRLHPSRDSDPWRHDPIGRIARIRHQAGHAKQQPVANGPVWPHRLYARECARAEATTYANRNRRSRQRRGSERRPLWHPHGTRRIARVLAPSSRKLSSVRARARHREKGRGSR